MSKYPTALTLTPEDRSMLESWVRAGKTERRLAERARMVLAAANGQSTIEIARTQRRRPATVSKWRVRFSQAGLTGLQDAPRPGAVPRYDETTRRACWTNWIRRRQQDMGPGAEGCWRRPWGMYPNIKSGACCAPKESIYNGAVAGASVPIRSLPPRQLISLPCTWTRRNTRSSFRWMKSRIFKPWSEPKAI